MENAGKSLTLYRPMEVSIKPRAIKCRCSIVYIDGAQVIISKNIVFLSLKIDFVLANSTSLWGFRPTKGK